MLSVIIPVDGEEPSSFDELISSIDSQDYTGDLKIYIAEDQISDSFREKILSLPDRYQFIPNKCQRKLFALENICRVLDSISNDSIIGIIDGDDLLMRSDCFSLVCDAHDKGFPVAWTANQWDLNGLNHSNILNDDIDVYEHPWVSSHFRTFDISLYNQVSKSNFLNEDGEYFEKCYDQALMLPIIHKAHEGGFKTKYIDKNCYIYRGRINHSSEGREKQLRYEKLIRERGYVK
tara:strand:+ start:32693 stop:33394 length:702 start_codon:yes stop_codon:yes gene_type:complete